MGVDIGQWITRYLPSALAALAILVVGWLVALFLASVVRNAVRRTKAGSTLATWLKGDGKEPPIEAEKWAGNPNRRKWWLLLLTLCLIFFLVACGSDSPSGNEDETENNESSHMDAEPDLERELTNDAIDDATGTSAFTYSGTGNELITVEQPCDGPTILYIKGNQGRELLQVSGYRSDRTRTKVFVDITDEPYEGITLDMSGSTVYLDIKTIGSWTIEIRPLSVARVIQASGVIKGRGDEVLLVEGSPKQASIKGNQDEKYLIITSYSPGKNPVGLVYTADVYEDTVLIADDTHLLEIKTFGEWEISLK